MNNPLQNFQLDIPSHRHVLNQLRIHGELSGAELARRVRLQPSTLVYILRSLKEKGFIRIARIDNSQARAGKPPTLWTLVPDIGYILGIEVIHGEIRGVIINFAGRVVERKILSDIKNTGRNALVDSLVQFVQTIGRSVSLTKIIGIGVATTGLVDRKTGVVRFSRKLELENVDLRRQLMDQLDVPVELVNDANAGALGLKWFQEPTLLDQSNIVFVTFNEKNHDIGIGLILNHKLYEGAHGTAGELSVQLPDLKDLVQTEKNHYTDAPLLEMKKIDFEAVLRCAKERGCPLSKYILAELGERLIEQIVYLVELIDPNLVIIGGDISAAQEFLKDQIAEGVKTKLRQALSKGFTMPQIRFSESGVYAVALGATALFLRQIFLPGATAQSD